MGKKIKPFKSHEKGGSEVMEAVFFSVMVVNHDEICFKVSKNMPEN
jgi:hypothetical protein